MEIWFLIFLSASLSILLKFLLSTLPNKKKNLPPGPPTVPFFGNLFLLRKSFFDLEPLLRQLHHQYGPIFTIFVGRQPTIFIADTNLAHQALIQKGSTFSDRPPATELGRILSSNQHNISSAGYGPLWRLLRRNLTSEILHPSRVKSYSKVRQWVLELLINQVGYHAKSDKPVLVLESFQHAMFCLLLFMCFGQKLDEEVIDDIEPVQRRMLEEFGKLNFFTVAPKLAKIVFRKRWNQLLQFRHELEQLLFTLIRACRDEQDEKFVFSYVDSLLTLELPEEGGRKLTDGEMVSLITEFISAGSDTTATTLQWVMANLVKYQDVQAKLAAEIEGVAGKEREIKEEDLQKMAYLKAVIMETLRRHPPGHFVLPHAVSEEVTIEGYVIPKEAIINFTVADMQRDEKVWNGAAEFRPERFLEGGETVDITGNREIKMMPFGAGRRICPGLNLAMLHLEYYVANLVREFEWKNKDGEEVDLAEKLDFTVVMKNPLQARVVSRRK